MALYHVLSMLISIVCLFGYLVLLLVDFLCELVGLERRRARVTTPAYLLAYDFLHNFVADHC